VDDACEVVDNVEWSVVCCDGDKDEGGLETVTGGPDVVVIDVANFTVVEEADADFVGADVVGADVVGADVVGADVEGAAKS
jgi:hypothetical protein